MLHTTEGEKFSSVYNWFSSRQANGVGAHFFVGRYGRKIQMADSRAYVYHAAGGNMWGIGIEQAGKASYSRPRWLLRRRQRRSVAWLIAKICRKEGLGAPSRENVRRHSDFPAGGHSDPGRGYPLDKVLESARAFYHKMG